MANLIAKSPAAGLCPLTISPWSLSEEAYDAITSVKPYHGQEKAVAAAIKEQTGAAWPAVGRATGKTGSRVVWAGLGEALVLGPSVTADGAAVTDQSDGWAVLSLDGTGATEVLARLTPLDLRDSSFKRGHAARSLLGHMTCLYVRTGAERYEMLVFRSMAQTAVHEIKHAMEGLAARAEG